MDDWLNPSHCVSNNLHKTARAVARVFGETMRPAGLQRSQFAILSSLNQNSPVKLTDLANALVMERTTLTRNLRPLEREGFIVIAASQRDARAREISITASGRSKYEEAIGLWREAQQKVVAKYGAEKWERLEEDLRSLRSLVTQGTYGARGDGPF